MKFVSKIAEKILGYCSKCGGCPMAKMIDAQAETGGKDSTCVPTKGQREAPEEKIQGEKSSESIH